jgi:maltose O-acetyltransferase
MLAGEYFAPGDPELCELRRNAQRALHAIREAESSMDDLRVRTLLAELFGYLGEGAVVNPGMRCDYGYNIELGPKAFLNYDCILLDCGKIRIGESTLVGPGAHFYAVRHPVLPYERCQPRNCQAASITVGENCWIGGGAKIMPGVTIGDGAIVAANSVVTRDVSPYTLVAGSPAMFIRQIVDTSEAA